MKYSYKYIFPVILIILHSCATDIPEDAFDYLAPPVISCRLVPGDNDHIYVDFTGSNNEYYFDGYNVYVSETQMLRTSVGSYKHVQVDEPGFASATPSYPLSPDPPQSGTIRLNQYWCPDYPDTPCTFADNVTYWIMLCSHHRYSGVNEDGVSNQVSITFEK